jgi:hypothetical protein
MLYMRPFGSRRTFLYSYAPSPVTKVQRLRASSLLNPSDPA